MRQPEPPAVMKLLHIAAVVAQQLEEEEHDDHHSGGGHQPISASSTFNLRLISIFVILVAGLLGVIPPLIGTWLSGSPHAVPARLIKACSSGIILALAMIHIIPESIEQLEGLGSSGHMPLGAVFVMAGLLGMMVLEYVCTYVSVHKLARKQQHHHHQHGSNSAAATNAAGLLPTVATTQQHGGKTAAATAAHHDKSAGHTCQPDSSLGKDHEHSHGHTHDHTHIAVQPELHGVRSLAHSTGCRQQPACHSDAVKQQVVCVTMELGCVFHSVVLGLALGVTTDAPSLVLTLLVVLAVHQAVEGLALGSVLAATERLSQRKKLVLAVVYALTLPAGIAAGILASASYSAESPVAVVVQGVANGLSGGMLVYVALFSLLAAELNRHDLLHRPLLAAGLFLSVLLGATIMSVIGIWA